MADSPDCDATTIMVQRFRSALRDTLRRVKTLIPQFNQLLDEQRAHEKQFKSRKATTAALGVVGTVAATTGAVVVLTSTGFALASPAALLVMGGAAVLGLPLIGTVVGRANKSNDAEDARKTDEFNAKVRECLRGYEADQRRLEGIVRKLEGSLRLLTGAVHGLDEHAALFVFLANPETFDVTDTHLGTVRRDRLQVGGVFARHSMQGVEASLEGLEDPLKIVAAMCSNSRTSSATKTGRDGTPAGGGEEEDDPGSQSSAARSATRSLTWDVRILADDWILTHPTVEAARKIRNSLHAQNDALQILSDALSSLHDKIRMLR